MTPWIVLALVVLVTTYVALTAWGAHRWSATTRGLGRQLRAARALPRTRAIGPSGYDPRDIEGLPEPV